MGLLSDLLGGLLKCLCGGQAEERPTHQPADTYVPPTLAHQPQVAQQPSAYPHTQQQPQPYPHPQPHRPTYAVQAQHKPQQAEYPHRPHEPKKHQNHGHNSSNSGGAYAHAHTAHTPDFPSPPSSPPPPSRPWSPGAPRPDPNQDNQDNPHYVSLRARANEAGDKMARNFEAAHQAYESGDGAGAKQLSNAGKEAQKEMERLNEEAALWIFRENNTDSGPGEVDLHGLYVKEAIRYADQSIVEARARGDTQIRFIVGKGLHSTNQVAKIKPAIEELIQKHGLIAELDQNNGGVLIVSLDGHATGRGAVLGAEELTRSIAETKDNCIIM